MKIICLIVIFLPFVSCAMEKHLKNESLGYVLSFAKSEQLKMKANLVIKKFDSNKEKIESNQLEYMKILIEPIRIALTTNVNTVNIKDYDCPELDEAKKHNISFEQLLEDMDDNIEEIRKISFKFDEIITQFNMIEKSSKLDTGFTIS